MVIRAYDLSRSPYLRKALVFSAVGHGVVLVMLLVSPRWFPVPDTSASTMDEIEVQLFSAIVSGSVVSEYESPPVRELTENAFPAAPDSQQKTEVPKPELPPVSSASGVKSKAEKSPESFPSKASVSKPDSAVSSPPESVQASKGASSQASPVLHAKTDASSLASTVIAPKAQAVAVVPAKSKPIQTSKVDRISLPSLKVPEVSEKKSVDALLDSIKAGINVPKSLTPVAPLPDVSKLARLSDMPAVLPETMGAPEILKRLAATVHEVLEDVKVPAPVDPVARVAPKLTEVPKVPQVQPKTAKESSEAKERAREKVKSIVKDTSSSIPEPMVLSKSLEHLDTVAVSSSSSSTPSVRSKLKGIRETVDAERHEDSSGPRVPKHGARQGKKVLDDYANRVKMIIDNNWHNPSEDDQLRVLVGVLLFPDGRVAQVVIKESSGNRVFDQSAMRAVKQSKRLPSFPAEIKKESLDLDLEFFKREDAKSS